MKTGQRSKIVITGFYPYLKNRENSSELAVNSVPEIGSDLVEIDRFVLPVRYKAVRDFANKIYDYNNLKAVIMFGLCPKTDKICLERVAINMEDSCYPDESGDTATDRRIIRDGPDAFFSTLPLRSIEKALIDNEYPCVISSTAGTYVCNSLFYRILYSLRGSDIYVGFIHLPPIKDEWTLQRLTDCVATISNAVIVSLDGYQRG